MTRREQEMACYLNFKKGEENFGTVEDDNVLIDNACLSLPFLMRSEPFKTLTSFKTGYCESRHVLQLYRCLVEGLIIGHLRNAQEYNESYTPQVFVKALELIKMTLNSDYVRKLVHLLIKYAYNTICTLAELAMCVCGSMYCDILRCELPLRFCTRIVYGAQDQLYLSALGALLDKTAIGSELKQDMVSLVHLSTFQSLLNDSFCCRLIVEDEGEDIEDTMKDDTTERSKDGMEESDVVDQNRRDSTPETNADELSEDCDDDDISLSDESNMSHDSFYTLNTLVHINVALAAIDPSGILMGKRDSTHTPLSLAG